MTKSRKRKRSKSRKNAFSPSRKIVQFPKKNGAKRLRRSFERSERAKNRESALIFRLRNNLAIRKRGAERVGPGFGRFGAGNVYFS